MRFALKSARNVVILLVALAVLEIGLPAIIAGAWAKVPVASIGKGNLVKLEVASSEPEITRGLMYRTAMPEDNGMVFLFRPSRKVNFWMCHTLIPLDMLFIKNGKIVKLFQQVPPCKSTEPNCRGCPTYPTGDGIEVDEVLEVNGGYASRHQVKEGDLVKFELPE